MQLDVRRLGLRRRHLVNAYEVKIGIAVIAGKLCDPCMSALSVSTPVLQKERYYTLTFFFTFTLVLPQSSLNHSPVAPLHVTET